MPLLEYKCPYCDTEFGMNILKAFDEEINKSQKEELNWEKEFSDNWQNEELKNIRI